MKYDVLINYCIPDKKIDSWYAYSDFPTFSSVISKFKREIKSVFDFVYVRKRFKTLNCVDVTTNFKLITSLSYTFNHYPKSTISINNSLNDLYINSLSNYKLTFDEIREVINEKN